MRKINSKFIIFLLFFLLPVYQPDCSADHIIIAADKWCPISCDPSDTKPGIMVEIAQLIFSNAGHTVEYKILPWARAIKISRKGEITGIIGAFVGDAPDFIFPENELLTVSGNSFFVTTSSNWFYKDVSSLSNIKLGAIIGYDYGEVINHYIKQGNNVQLIGGENPLERNIHKLLSGRINVLIEAAPVLWNIASNMGVSHKIKAAGQVEKAQKCYIAFSPAIPKSKEYAKMLSVGVDLLRKSGELKKILSKYGLDDWKTTKK